MVGLLGLVRVGPLVIFSLLGGVIADQFDRRKVMLSARMAMTVVTLFLFLFTIQGLATVWTLYALVGFHASALAFDRPARQSLAVNLVPPAHLPNALSLNGITWRLSDVLGPILSGSLIALEPDTARGIAFCYGFNLLTFAVDLGTTSLLRSRPSSAERIRSVRQVFGSISDGIQFMRQTPVVRNAMWLDFWATFFSSADALLPAFADKIFALGPQGYGWLLASPALGALLAATWMSIRPTFQHQGRWVISMIFVYGLFTIFFGLSPNPWVAGLCLAGTGAADMISTVLRQTIRQLATPDSMRGRMTSIGSLFQISGPQLGDFESGALSRWQGERISVAIGGLACLFIAGHWNRKSALKDYTHASEP
jgi:MFS family permease